MVASRAEISMVKFWHIVLFALGGLVTLDAAIGGLGSSLMHA
jgi:hypothetical protein